MIHTQSGRHLTGWMIGGSGALLLLALCLAVLSGDILLVLAVTTGIAGLVLLMPRREAPGTATAGLRGHPRPSSRPASLSPSRLR